MKCESPNEEIAAINEAINFIGSRYNSDIAYDLSQRLQQGNIKIDSTINYHGYVDPYSKDINLGYSNSLQGVLISNQALVSSHSDLKNIEGAFLTNTEKLRQLECRKKNIENQKVRKLDHIIFLASILIHERYHSMRDRNEYEAYKAQVTFLHRIYLDIQRRNPSDPILKEIYNRAVTIQGEFYRFHGMYIYHIDIFPEPKP